MEFYILSDNLQLLETVSALIDQGEGYPRPDGLTLHHALMETSPPGVEFALIADDVAAKYIGLLVAAVTANEGDAAQVAADWQALQAGTVEGLEYVFPAGPFTGQSVRIGVKGNEWTQGDMVGLTPPVFGG
jgi:hypothetical protein